VEKVGSQLLSLGQLGPIICLQRTRIFEPCRPRPASSPRTQASSRGHEVGYQLDGSQCATMRERTLTAVWPHQIGEGACDSAAAVRGFARTGRRLDAALREALSQGGSQA
jgi:hypothetical protein